MAKGNSHDQNFKNLIADYPRQSIQFFAPHEAAQIDNWVKIIPLRQEQLKERLGERFRELDTPLLLEWPDGRREAIIFMLEEHTDTRRFEIDKLAHYCLDIAKLCDTQRIVPVVIFLRPGHYPLSLELGSEYHTFLQFHYIACALWELRAEDHLESDNLVARLNLPLMYFAPEQRVAIYDRAVDGLFRLESRVEYQHKYLEFVDFYASLDETEYQQYERDYLKRNEQRDMIMGAFQKRLQAVSEQSKADGIIEGEIKVLKRQLTLRFGPLPTWALDKLQNASAKQLEAWAERIFNADNLETFFE